MHSRRAAYVYSDALWRHVLREGHPMRPARLRYTYELLEAYGAFDGQRSRLVAPRPATEDEVCSFHAPEYARAVRDFSRGLRLDQQARYGFSDWGDNPTYPGMDEAALLATGASVVGAELVASRQVDVAFNTAGGLHHAAAGHASGFCVFNDPMVAIHVLLRGGLRVAYVDIDAHHGDGVQDAFYTTDRVLTISLHESGHYLFPGTGFVTEMGEGPGQGHAVNVPLAPDTGDDVYLWALEQVVPPMVHAFKPDVLVTQLGIDTYVSDPLAHLALTSRGFEGAVRLLGGLGYPWLALGGGGYDVFAVARCWALAYGVMVGRTWPDQVPEAFRDRYGIKALRDAGPPPQVAAQDRARREAEESVEAVRRLIFPLHGLSAT